MYRKEQDSVRIARREAVGMDFLVEEFIREMKISSGLNLQRIYAAWDQVSGAAGHTLRRFFKGGNLYVAVSSSLVRQQLFLQRRDLVERINKVLEDDELFTKDDPRTGYVKNIILQ